MGGDEGGDVFAAHHAQQFAEHDVGGRDIEIAGGFIGQQEFGRVGHGAGDGDALAFAAGELAGQMIGAAGKAEGFEQFQAARFGGFVGNARDQLRNGNIFERGEFGEQMVRLVDETDFITP